MSDEKPTGERVAYGIIAQGQLADLQSYLERGRQLEGLSLEQLQARLVSGARAWREAPFSPPIVFDDVKSEYALRKERPPYDLARDDIEAAIAAITARAEEMTDEELDEVNAAMIADYKKGSRSRN